LPYKNVGGAAHQKPQEGVCVKGHKTEHIVFYMTANRNKEVMVQHVCSLLGNRDFCFFYEVNLPFIGSNVLDSWIRILSPTQISRKVV
jgi:hypothetical protein